MKHIFWRGPTAVVHRNERVLKNIFKRGYEEIRDRKLLEILKKDRTWLKYELHCNVKTPAPQTEIKLSFFVEHLNSWFAGTHVLYKLSRSWTYYFLLKTTEIITIVAVLDQSTVTFQKELSFFVEHLNSWFAGTHENLYTMNKNEFTVPHKL
jgi:hypothetical protein